MSAYAAHKRSHGAKITCAEVIVNSSRWQSVNTESFHPLPSLVGVPLIIMRGPLPAMSALRSMTGELKVTAQMNFYCCCNEVDKLFGCGIKIKKNKKKDHMD